MNRTSGSLLQHEHTNTSRTLGGWCGPGSLIAVIVYFYTTITHTHTHWSLFFFSHHIIFSFLNCRHSHHTTKYSHDLCNTCCRESEKFSVYTRIPSFSNTGFSFCITLENTSRYRSFEGGTRSQLYIPLQGNDKSVVTSVCVCVPWDGAYSWAMSGLTERGS